VFNKASYQSKDILKEQIQAARSEIDCDLVIKNCKFLDVYSGEFLVGDVAVHNGYFVGTRESYNGKQEVDAGGSYLVPGFIDSHVHIESSMMTPVRFQQSVLPCGTTSVFWDPHEIANVKGVNGIKWALNASEGLDLDVFVMVPSCVPSTSPAMGLETSGFELGPGDIEEFRDHPRVLGLAEMMNFPGLLMGDDDVVSKLDSFQNMKRDGHCPGLSGKDLNAYAAAGIHSCHESTSFEEAKEKMQKGFNVLIREGSCAKDARQLLPLVNAYSSAILALCSDDRNPLDIAEEGHISFIINLALKAGIAPQDIFRVASFSAARSYGLEDRGVIAPGHLADFVLVETVDKDSWSNGVKLQDVYKKGKLVDREELKSRAQTQTALDDAVNMNLAQVTTKDFLVEANAKDKQSVKVIGVIPRQIVTENLQATLNVENGGVHADIETDVLKISVFERHHRSGRRGIGFVQGFGLKSGAIATSVNHDSHNAIVVGANDEAMATALNRLIEIDGGVVVVDHQGNFEELALPYGGLMSDIEPGAIAEHLKALKKMAVSLGCQLEEPFITLSFLALPVIPSLKITDRGLVDVNQFSLVDVLN